MGRWENEEARGKREKKKGTKHNFTYALSLLPFALFSTSDYSQIDVTEKHCFASLC